MKNIETRVIQVPNNPNVINMTNEAWRYWGWTVLNVQITNTRDSRISGGAYNSFASDGITIGTGTMEIETTEINYATITYQRDRGMDNYQRIAELQQEYETIEIRAKTALVDRYKEIGMMRDELDKLRRPAPIWLACLRVLIGLAWFIIPGVIIALYEIYKHIKWNEAAQKYGKYEKRWDKVHRLEKRLESDVTAMIENERERIIRERDELVWA